MNTWGEISTDQAGPRDRLALWTDALWHLLGRLRSNAYAASSFRGRLVHGEIGSLKLCRLSASSHRVERTPDLIGQDDRGFLKVVIQIEGFACLEQNGRKTLLSPGEWSIYDTARPYTVSNTSDVEQLLLLVPREKILTRSLDLNDSLARQYSARTGIGRLTCELMRAAFDEIPAYNRQSAEDVADSISNLIRHSLLERCGQPSDLSVRENLRDLIKAYLDRNLRDPGLSIDQLANAFNCTKRNLHKAFSSEGTTISNNILKLRLERCRSDLDNPAHSAKSITDVAFFWGFNSSTHFSRAFKDAYGVPPQAYRLSRRNDSSPLEIPRPSAQGIAAVG